MRNVPTIRTATPAISFGPLFGSRRAMPDPVDPLPLRRDAHDRRVCLGARTHPCVTPSDSSANNSSMIDSPSAAARAPPSLIAAQTIRFLSNSRQIC